MDDDKTLVAAARRGDDSAWGVIYDRYADKLHDHCYRILRDRDEAADALHDAFIAASRNLEQLRDPSRLRPWLYSISRHCALRRLKARDRVELTDAPDEMTAPENDLDRGMAAEELGELVWAAAAGLNPRDQALLDLSVRQGLEGQDLADAMGTSLSNSYVMLSRMRDQVERSLGALLIARLGRDDCDELDGLLAGWDGKFSPLLRKRVARHVDSCEICSHKRSTVASPMALLAVVPVTPAPSILKGRVISSVRNWEVHDSPSITWTKDGFAALDEGAAPRRITGAWMATAVAVLLVLGALFLAGQGDSGPSGVETAAGPTQERARVTTTTEATTTTVDPLVIDATSTSLGGATPTSKQPGTTATTVAPGATNPTNPTTPTTAPSTTTTIAVTVGRPTASPSALPCGGGEATVTARVTGSPEAVRLVASNGTKAMQKVGDDTYETTVSTTQTIQLVAQAKVNGQWKGSSATTLTVRGCDSTSQAPPSSSPPPVIGPGNT